jgi:hypothetical protein
MSRKRFYGVLYILAALIPGIMNIQHVYAVGDKSLVFFIVLRLIFVVMTLGFICFRPRPGIDESMLGTVLLSIFMISFLADESLSESAHRFIGHIH